MDISPKRIYKWLNASRISLRASDVRREKTFNTVNLQTGTQIETTMCDRSAPTGMAIARKTGHSKCWRWGGEIGTCADRR